MRWFREKIRIVAAVPEPFQRAGLQGIAADEGWIVQQANDCGSALEELRHHEGAVVLLDRDLPGCDWRGALEQLRALKPRVPVILTTPETDDKLWLEVLDRGGYDVVTRPFHARRLVEAINGAWRQISK